MKRSWPLILLLHTGAWLLFFGLVIAFIATGPNKNADIPLFSPPFLLFYFVYVSLFYFNAYILIHKLYFKGKYFVYAAVLLVLFIGIFFLRPYDNIHVASKAYNISSGKSPGKGPVIDIISLILFLMVCSFGAAWQIVRQWRRIERRALQAEAGRAIAELSFLKAQINPHFLFNTLNNIYSLAVGKSNDTALAIMKLSSILRYVTDEAENNFVELENEIKCISDYIDLQRMRMGKVQVNFSVTGNQARKMIPPLILMNFIENAFKHGVSSHEPSTITIKISTDEKSITFYCKNKKFSNSSIEERTGVGIPNTVQRLQHLYPNKYSLDFDKGTEYFCVTLILHS